MRVSSSLGSRVVSVASPSPGKSTTARDAAGSVRAATTPFVSASASTDTTTGVKALRQRPEVTADDGEQASATGEVRPAAQREARGPRLALPSLPKTPLLECGDRTMLGTVQIERATSQSQPSSANVVTKPATSPSQAVKASTRGAQIATSERAVRGRAPPPSRLKRATATRRDARAAREWNRTPARAALPASGLPSGFRRSHEGPVALADHDDAVGASHSAQPRHRQVALFELDQEGGGSTPHDRPTRPPGKCGRPYRALMVLRAYQRRREKKPSSASTRITIRISRECSCGLTLPSGLRVVDC